MVRVPDFGSGGLGYESCWRQNSSHDCIACGCTEPFIIILPSSQYDLSNVERDIKHQYHHLHHKVSAVICFI